MLRTLLRALPRTAAIAVVGLGVFVPGAGAFEIEPHPGTDVTKGIAGMPGRIELEVEPGRTSTTEVSFQNRTGSTQHFGIEILDVQGSDDPDNFLQIVRDAKYGASSWITVDKPEFDLQHGDIAHLKVTVNVPADASPGSYYSAIDGKVLMENEGTSGGSGAIQASASVAVQLFFNVPGDLVYAGELKSIDAPRLYQRSRGSYISAGITYLNTGNVTDIVGGKLEFENFLGKTAHELPLEQHVMLRGGARRFDILWTKPPWIGRFTPKVTVVGKSGKPITKTFPAIWVIPSWKYWVAVLLSLAVPIGWQIRQRRSWRRYLDEEWDEDLEEDWDPEDESEEAYDF